MDELHDHASAHSKVSMTTADWRKKMMDCLEDDVSSYIRIRFDKYREAGIPEYVFHDLDAAVFHAALRRLAEKNDAKAD